MTTESSQESGVIESEATTAAANITSTGLENQASLSESAIEKHGDFKEPKDQEGGKLVEPMKEKSSANSPNPNDSSLKDGVAPEVGASKHGHRAGGRGDFIREDRKHGRGEGRHGGRYEPRQHGREGPELGHRGRGPPKRDERESRARGRGRDGREGRGGRGGAHIDSVQPAHDEVKHPEVSEPAVSPDEFATISSKKSIKADEEKVSIAQTKNEQLVRSVNAALLHHAI